MESDIAQAQDDIKILKSIWQKDASGAWSVHDLQAIALKPKEGFGRNFFKVKDEMNVLTQRPGRIIENLFATFGFTEFLVRQSIVSQREFAKKLKRDYNFVWRIEGGERQVNVLDFVEIAIAADIEPTDLLKKALR